MRQDSYGLEAYSLYQDRSMTDIAVFDGGDLRLPPGDPRPALQRIERQTADIMGDNKIPGMIGGEHLVTLGAVRAVAAKHPDAHIIQFDAHADLRDTCFGQKLSHGSVLRRCHDVLGDGRIHQFGIRSISRGEKTWAEGRVRMQPFDFTGLAATVDALGGKPVYLTLDLDVLDPSVLPGTGTPDAGGVTFHQLLEACLVVAEANVVGFDICELSPPLDPSGASTAAACKILRELLLALG